MVDTEKDPFTVVVVVGLVSFLISMVALVLLYTACVRKYRLNWFEKNLLESVEKGSNNKEKR